jgi:hypothetical protein
MICAIPGPIRAPLLGAVLLALAGCSENGPGTTVYTGNQISDYVAEWDGYAEAFETEGTKLVGTLATSDGYTRYTVRLTRQ